MQFEIDWHYLKPALVVLGISLLISAAMLVLSMDYLSNAEQRYESEKTAQMALKTKYLNAVDDKRLIEVYRGQYQTLVHKGVVNDEHRLDWVDTLRASVKALKLPRMHFQFKPQRSFAAGYIDSGSVNVNTSRMMLDIGLLHEVDLLRLFTLLEHRVPGMFHIDNCSMLRNEDEFEYGVDRSNLNVNCELQWFTIAVGNRPTARGTNI